MFVKKTIFIIPGFRQTPSQRAYISLKKMLRKIGYYPVVVRMGWKNTTFVQNTDNFIKVYNSVRRKKKYILGFSFGAMIAFNAATKVKSSGLILCSLSPFFEEDVPFAKFNCSQLAKKVKTKQVRFIYGQNEARTLIERTRKAYREINKKDKTITSIKKTTHNIGDKKYLGEINQIARGLS